MFTDIETKRCRLRFFRETDLETFAKYRSDPDVARFQSWSSYSYEDAVELYQDITGKPFGLDGHWYQIALADRDTDELIGDFGIHFISAEIVEVGFTISPVFQGKGYGTEGLSALLSYLFETLCVERVVAVTDAKNGASIRLLELVGFEREGDIRTVIFKGEPGEEYDYIYQREKWRLRNGS